MEQTLEIINIIRVSLVIMLGATSVIFWECYPECKILYEVTQLGLTTVIFALQIPIVVLGIFLNQSYGMEIFYLCLAVVYLVRTSLVIGYKMRKKQIPRVIRNIFGEPSKGESEETSDNQ